MILYCPFKWFTIQSCKNDLKEQLEWAFMLTTSPSSHVNQGPLFQQRNSCIWSFSDTTWRLQGAQGHWLDSSSCPSTAQRTPVPVLSSSSGLTWRPQGARGHPLDSSCYPSAAVQRTPVPDTSSWEISWRLQGARGHPLDFSSCPSTAPRTSVPILTCSSGITWRLQGTQGHLLNFSSCLHTAQRTQSQSFLFPQRLGKKRWEVLGRMRRGSGKEEWWGAAAGAGALCKIVSFQRQDGNWEPLVRRQM